jgi:chemotaxis protein CheZ
MAPENLTFIDADLVSELKNCAKLLAEKLQSDQIEEASQLIQSLANARDKHIFQSVGKLTRGLHNAIINFDLDTDIAGGADGALTLNASDKLNYVIEITQNAANKTMDAVEEAAPIAVNLGQEAGHLHKDWQRLRRREMSPDEFRQLYERTDIFLSQMVLGTDQIGKSLQNIVLEQGFQDLSGQVLKRVIKLIGDVERDLVTLVRIAGQVEEVAGIADHIDSIEGAVEIQQKDNSLVQGEGPQIVKNNPGVVANQDEVDDLLSSLGF